jgi:hypothetical protein
MMIQLSYFHNKKARHEAWLSFLFGAGNGIRTRDFNLGKVALYH